jgi:hypothetical protein
VAGARRSLGALLAVSMTWSVALSGCAPTELVVVIEGSEEPVGSLTIRARTPGGTELGAGSVGAPVYPVWTVIESRGGGPVVIEVEWSPDERASSSLSFLTSFVIGQRRMLAVTLPPRCYTACEQCNAGCLRDPLQNCCIEVDPDSLLPWSPIESP